MENILYAGGCSHTQGFGMDDVGNTFVDNFKTSKFSWPALLGEQMGVSVINDSRPGASNNLITRKAIISIKNLIQQNKKPNAVFMMTYSHRRELFLKTLNNPVTLSLWYEKLNQGRGFNAAALGYFEYIQNSIQDKTDLLQHIILLKSFCDNENIPCKFMFSDVEDAMLTDEEKSHSLSSNWNDLSWILESKSILKLNSIPFAYTNYAKDYNFSTKHTFHYGEDFSKYAVDSFILNNVSPGNV
jgi:hypothetical protein